MKKAATAAPRPIVPSTTTAFKPHAAPAAPAKFSIFCDEEPEPAPKSSGFRIFCDDDCLDVKDLKPKVGLKPPAAALGVYVDEKFDER